MKESLIKVPAVSVAVFCLGFIIGTILDTVFYHVYHLVDPDEKSNIILAILFLVLSCNFFGDWIRDRLDPKLRQV